MGRWQYSRWRRVLMQVALCAIFAGSVGLAAMVTRERLASGNTRLAGIRWFGRVGIRAPQGWALEAINQGPIMLMAQEPQVVIDGVEKGGRRLLVRRTQLDAPTSPDEFLKTSGLLRGSRPLTIDDADITDSITIAGTVGILRPVIRLAGLAIFSPPAYITEWIACVVRPSGLALTLQLDCPDNSDLEGDKQALRDIASGMEIRGAASFDPL